MKKFSAEHVMKELRNTELLLQAQFMRAEQASEIRGEIVRKLGALIEGRGTSKRCRRGLGAGGQI